MEPSGFMRLRNITEKGRMVTQSTNHYGHVQSLQL